MYKSKKKERKKKAKGSFPSKKENNKRKKLGRKDNVLSQNANKYKSFCSLKFSKLCLTVNAKIVTLSYAVLNVCKSI